MMKSNKPKMTEYGYERIESLAQIRPAVARVGFEETPEPNN